MPTSTKANGHRGDRFLFNSFSMPRKALRYAARSQMPILIRDGHRLIGHASYTREWGCFLDP